VSTDLTIHEPAQVEHFTSYSDPTGGRLVAWAEGLAAAHRIGSALCQTSFVPQHFRGKPQEAAAAILYGDEIGFTPTQAVQNLYVISGKPALYARSMVALVMSKGHEVWTVEKSDAKVTVAGRRKGTTHTIEETWTTGRAQKAGYTNNKKYATDPQAMLYARAAADICRQIAPDALAGLAYSAEEMELSEEQPTTTVRRETPTRARRASAPAPEPDLEPAPQNDDGAVAPEPPVTAVEDSRSAEDPSSAPSSSPSDAQRGLMFASFKDAGFTTDARTAEGRQARLDYIGNVIGRQIETSNDLTVDEMSQVIDSLKADADAETDPWGGGDDA
jgi:hypothetical protein